MTEEALLPSEIREKVLAQHREIEEMLADLQTGASDSEQSPETWVEQSFT
jgi:hypothetical protein